MNVLNALIQTRNWRHVQAYAQNVAVLADFNTMY